MHAKIHVILSYLTTYAPRLAHPTLSSITCTIYEAIDLPSSHRPMVYYFKSAVVDPPAFLYMGKEKVESEYPRMT